MAIVQRRMIVRIYTSEGVKELTPRRPGELYYHQEFQTYEKLTEKQKKLQKQIDAIKRRNNGKPPKNTIR